MDHLYITLHMNLTADAKEGPGWYITAHSPEKRFIDPVGVSPQAAYEAARALQEALQSTEGELPQISLIQLAESGTKLIRQATENALRYAEEQAAKVGTLRKRLVSMGKADA